LTAVAAIAAVTAGAVLPAAASAAPTPGAPLSCDGSTIYAYTRGEKTSAPFSDGSVYSIPSSSIGSGTAQATLVTSIPAGSFANGLGITKGGTAMYAVDQRTTAANTAVVHAYNTSTKTWSTFAGSSGVNQFVAGAVNPADGIYYYAGYTAGSSSSPGTGVIYGFNTVTNTAIPGTIGTFDLPYGNLAGGPNGDMTFDSAGNLYVLASQGTQVAIGVITGPLPTTGSASGAALTDTKLSNFDSKAVYNGIAFDNAGNLYGETILPNGAAITKLNPNTGAVIAGPSLLSDNAQKYTAVDLAACSLNPTLELRKNVVGRYAASDQFKLSITGGGVTSNNTATTTGSATGIQADDAGPVIAMSKASYTLTETAAGGNLANYTTTYACVDTANGNAAVASGTGQSFTLPFPATAVIAQNVVCTFTNTPVRASITIKKSVAETNLVTGETLHYSFLVTNTGSVPLTSVAVAEGAFTGHGTMSAVSCPVTTLAPAASTTCTATYTVLQSDVDAGKVDNTASSSGVTPAGQTVVSPNSSASVPGTSSPALTLVKTADPTSITAAGETVDYSFLVTNTGNVTLTDVGVTETAFSGSGTAPAISCPADTLAPTASQTCTATYTVTQADVDAGEITNTATAHGTPPGSTTPVVSPPDSARVTAPASPSLTVVKSASPNDSDSFTVGRLVTYSFVVTNTGNVTLTDVTVHEGTFTGSGTMSAPNCPTNTLVPGAQLTCTATYTVTQADIDAGSVTNKATATGTPPTGPDVDTPPSEVTIPGNQHPAITIVKSATPAMVSKIGTAVTYSFLVTNTGNVTLTHVTVHEGAFTGSGTMSPPVCPAGAASMAPGAEVTCTAGYTVTQADVDAGSITNTATATGTPPSGPDVVSPPSTVRIPINAAAKLGLVKTGRAVDLNGDRITNAGDRVDWTLKVTNLGTTTITDITVSDPSAGAVKCPHTSLAPGASMTCTVLSHSVTAADAAKGIVVNTATAGGIGPGGPVTSNKAVASVPVHRKVTPPVTVTPPPPGRLPFTGVAFGSQLIMGGVGLAVIGVLFVLTARRRDQ
jgi:uncharacterized repeat protein (TIGR01451 family)